MPSQAHPISYSRRGPTPRGLRRCGSWWSGDLGWQVVVGRRITEAVLPIMRSH